MSTSFCRAETKDVTSAGRASNLKQSDITLIASKWRHLLKYWAMGIFI